MNWVLAGTLLLGSISQEVNQVIERSEALINEEVEEFLQELQKDRKECSKCRQPQFVAADKQNLLVFMSFSVPLESWKDWSHSIEKRGGVFVLRGLPGNSFRLFSQKVSELKNAGVNAPIRIDPEAFEQYGIEAVPSVVLLKDKKWDKIEGNIRWEDVFKSLFS